jgi:hypothetical protein
LRKVLIAWLCLWVGREWDLVVMVRLLNLFYSHVFMWFNRWNAMNFFTIFRATLYFFPLFVCICIVCSVLNGKPFWFVGYLYADVVGSAIGFTIFAAILCSWALTFSIGGERLFGPVWDQLVMYNLADRLGLIGWS